MAKERVPGFEELKAITDAEERALKTKRILFSPIGITDIKAEIGEETEGPLFHILRNNKFHTVYLFLTKEIVYGKGEVRGLNEYSLCERIEEIKNNSGTQSSVEIVYIVGKDGDKPQMIMDEKKLSNIDLIEKPHLYNESIKFFNEGITEALDNYKQENDLKNEHIKPYFNVSSGTAAMQIGLISYSLFYSYLYDFTLLQVGNPDYGKGNRIKNIDLPYTTKKLLTEKSKNLILSYNYEQALKLIADSYSKDARVLKYIKGCIARTNLDFEGAKKGFSKTEFDFNKADAQDAKLGSRERLVEYLNILKIQSNKNEYNDFYRALTPAITNILALVITENFEILLSQYIDSRGVRVLTKSEEGRQAYVLSEGKYNEMLDDEPKLKVLWDYFLADGKKEMGKSFVSNKVLFDVIKDLAKKEKHKVSIENLEIIIDFEYGKKYENMYLRNRLAHQITNIAMKEIKQATGITPNEWFLKVWEVMFRGKSIEETEAFNLYDRINEAIITELDKS